MSEELQGKEAEKARETSEYSSMDTDGAEESAVLVSVRCPHFECLQEWYLGWERGVIIFYRGVSLYIFP